MSIQQTSAVDKLSGLYAEWAGDRQCEATRLAAVLDAAETLTTENLSPKVVAELINVARAMAEDLSVALDAIHLPKGGAA